MALGSNPVAVFCAAASEDSSQPPVALARLNIRLVKTEALPLTEPSPHSRNRSRAAVTGNISARHSATNSPTPKPTRVFGCTPHDIQSLAKAYCQIKEVIAFSARGSVAGPALKSFFRSPMTLSTILRNERNALQSSDRS